MTHAKAVFKSAVIKRKPTGIYKHNVKLVLF